MSEATTTEAAAEVAVASSASPDPSPPHDSTAATRDAPPTTTAAAASSASPPTHSAAASSSSTPASSAVSASSPVLSSQPNRTMSSSGIQSPTRLASQSGSAMAGAEAAAAAAPASPLLSPSLSSTTSAVLAQAPSMSASPAMSPTAAKPPEPASPPPKPRLSSPPLTSPPQPASTPPPAASPSGASHEQLSSPVKTPRPLPPVSVVSSPPPASRPTSTPSASSSAGLKSPVVKPVLKTAASSPVSGPVQSPPATSASASSTQASPSPPAFPLAANVQAALLAKSSGQTDAYGNTTRCICLTGDHRVLTRGGWRSITRMQVGDVVLSFNIATYAMEWKPVCAVKSHAIDRLEAADALYRMQGSGMDVIATRDHRMLLARLSSFSGLAKRQPIVYAPVGQLLPPNLTYSAVKSTASCFLECRARAVVRASFNTQPGVKVVIPGLERMCDWWWEVDGQLGFLRFLGFWLRDGHLATSAGSVRIRQKKELALDCLEPLLRAVFPRCWYRSINSADSDSCVYSIRCPPLYDYLRLMAVGPVGYNPHNPVELRSYPHFTKDEGLAAKEQQSAYCRPNALGSEATWTEDAMLAAGCGDGVGVATMEVAATAPDDEEDTLEVLAKAALAIEDSAVSQQQEAGNISCLNGTESIIIDRQWSYLKRWLGNQVQIANVYSQLSRQQAIALLHGFCRSDDKRESVKYDTSGEPTGRWRCSSVSFPLIDHLMLIGQLAGAAVDLRRSSRAGRNSCFDGRPLTFSVDHWALLFSFTESARALPFQTALLAQPVDVSDDIGGRGYYQYTDDGIVYCVTVDGNANFLTQRLSSTRLQSGKTGVRAHSMFIGNCHDNDNSDGFMLSCDTCIAVDTPVSVSTGLARPIQLITAADTQLAAVQGDEMRSTVLARGAVGSNDKGERAVSRLWLGNGQHLDLTDDHRVFVRSRKGDAAGWKRARELRPSRPQLRSEAEQAEDDCDMVMMGLDSAVDDERLDTEDERQWTLPFPASPLPPLSFSSLPLPLMPHCTHRDRALAFARLLGHIVGCGRVRRVRRLGIEHCLLRVRLHHAINVQEWQQDVSIVAHSADGQQLAFPLRWRSRDAGFNGELASAPAQGYWTATLPLVLSSALCALEGVTDGHPGSSRVCCPPFFLAAYTDRPPPAAFLREYLASLFGARGLPMRCRRRRSDGLGELDRRLLLPAPPPCPHHSLSPSSFLSDFQLLLLRAGCDSRIVAARKSRARPSPSSPLSLCLTDPVRFSRCVSYRYSAHKQLRLSLACAFIRQQQTSSALKTADTGCAQQTLLVSSFSHFLSAVGQPELFSSTASALSCSLPVYYLPFFCLQPLPRAVPVYDLSMRAGHPRSFLASSIAVHNCDVWQHGDCFTESDTRLLTDYGLLFLEQIEALQMTGHEVLFGCYEEQLKQMRYSKGKLVFPQQPPPYLVEFTSAGEAARWAERSGNYGIEGVAEDDPSSSHVSLRVTPGHDMYVQLGDSRISKMQAQAVLSADARASVRMLACAEAGYAPQPTSWSRTVWRDLNLENTQYAAFFQLLGFWLGDGSLDYWPVIGSAAGFVTFDHVKQTDLRWLCSALKQAGLREDEHWLFSSSGSETVVHIKKPTWFVFFDVEFGIGWGPAVQPQTVKSVLHLPDWTLRELSAGGMRLLISGLHRASGSRAEAMKEIHTSSARFRDQLVQALLHCGYSAYAGLIHGDAWKVSWAEPNPVHNTSAADSCWPSVSGELCVTRVPYDAERDGRTWCVQVEHEDHLIIAQRAQRGPDGAVIQQSRPVVVGNCLSVTERSVPEQYFCDICMPDHPIHTRNDSVRKSALNRKNKGKGKKAAIAAAAGGVRDTAAMPGSPGMEGKKKLAQGEKKKPLAGGATAAGKDGKGDRERERDRPGGKAEMVKKKKIRREDDGTAGGSFAGERKDGREQQQPASKRVKLDDTSKLSAAEREEKERQQQQQPLPAASTASDVPIQPADASESGGDGATDVREQKKLKKLLETIKKIEDQSVRKKKREGDGAGGGGQGLDGKEKDDGSSHVGVVGVAAVNDSGVADDDATMDSTSNPSSPDVYTARSVRAKLRAEREEQDGVPGPPEAALAAFSGGEALAASSVAAGRGGDGGGGRRKKKTAASSSGGSEDEDDGSELVDFARRRRIWQDNKQRKAKLGPFYLGRKDWLLRDWRRERDREGSGWDDRVKEEELAMAKRVVDNWKLEQQERQRAEAAGGSRMRRQTNVDGVPTITSSVVVQPHPTAASYSSSPSSLPADVNGERKRNREDFPEHDAGQAVSRNGSHAPAASSSFSSPISPPPSHPAASSSSRPSIPKVSRPMVNGLAVGKTAASSSSSAGSAGVSSIPRLVNNRLPSGSGNSGTGSSSGMQLH